MVKVWSQSPKTYRFEVSSVVVGKHSCQKQQAQHGKQQQAPQQSACLRQPLRCLRAGC